jgi:hypothetical protein
MKQHFLLSLPFFLLVAWHNPAHAQAGHPKDSIMSVVNKCSDCSALTWGTSNGLTTMSYSIGTSGVSHKFYFDKSNTCVRYEEHYPTKNYMVPVAAYMDSLYTKIGAYEWKETLYTIYDVPVIDYCVYWSIVVLPDNKLVVVGEFKKIRQ